MIFLAGVILWFTTFANHPNFGAVCTQLVKRIEQHQLPGFISTHVLSEIAHRLMTLEALDRFGWPPAGIAARPAQASLRICGSPRGAISWGQPALFLAWGQTVGTWAGSRGRVPPRSRSIGDVPFSIPQ